MIKTNPLRLNKRFINIVMVIIFIFHSNNSYSQGLRLIGSIYNNETHELIQFANISVKNISIGTCTNSNGDFVLYLPDSLSKSKLEVSCIGYKGCSLPIDSLIGIDTLLISLIPIEYQIRDIVVIPGENDVHTIFKKVISKIDDNYSGKKYFLEAFFRHRVYNHYNNDKTVRLTEAAISIHQEHTSNDNKKVQVKEIRNSKNYAELSSSAGRKLLYAALGGDQNPIYRSLLVERLAQKKFLKKLSKSDHYSIALSDVSILDDVLVYIIEFRQESWEFLYKKYLTTHTYRKYRYYINAKDFAILKVEDFWISHNPESKPFVKNDSIESQYFIQYRKFDEKYYPAYVYFYGMIPDMVSKVDKKNFYYHEVELMVNEIATRRKDYDRIRNRNLMSKSKTLWDLEYDYNPEFWENYNLLLDNPMNPQYKNELEIEKPLDEQFKKK